MANAGRGTGWTWCATPTATASASTTIGPKPGAIAITSSRSLNADKPYDRFVKEQLAGDELWPDDPDALAATGYLRHWIYEYNNRDVARQWGNILNDMTDVTGDVFLGLGCRCARCHDHKFDPILQKDYFRLQAFFASISRAMICRWPRAAEQRRYRAACARLGRKPPPISVR